MTDNDEVFVRLEIRVTGVLERSDNQEHRYERPETGAVNPASVSHRHKYTDTRTVGTCCGHIDAAR